MNLLEECRGAKRIGISGHVRPDGDCVGSCLALYNYLKNYLPGETKVQVFLEQPSDIFNEIKGFDVIDNTFSAQEPFDVYFALDCNAERLGEAEPLFRSAVKTINIDHHISNSGAGDINVVEPEVGSVCEVLYSLMEEDKLDKDIAMALYIGMIHDTGVFQYSNTRPETLKIAAHLISFGFDFPRLIEETFYQKSYKQARVMGHALVESTAWLEGQCVAAVIDRKTMDLYGVDTRDFEGIVNQLRNIKGVHCAVFMYEKAEEEYKVSLRTDEMVDAVKVVSSFDGGGHIRAAGCTMKGSPEECLQAIMEQVGKQLKKNDR